jgi:glycine/D-amino acid oxidase-like deaminating enzyme
MLTQLPEEHCRSYYAASKNDQTVYPSLTGSVTVDVCVIGAGFTGVSAALTLAERGHSVAVIEANRVGWGATGRNGGQVISGFNGASKIIKRHGNHVADTVWEMDRLGNKIIRNRVEKYKIECDLKNGFLDVALNKRQMRGIEEDYEALKQSNYEYDLQLLNQSEVSKIIGTSKYFGGIIRKGDGHIHPLNLCLGEAAAAVKLGAHIFEQSPVVQIQHGDSPRVITANGEVVAKSIVLAGNAYHMLEKKRLAGLLFPANSYMIATEPLGEDMVKEINPQDLAICDVNHVPTYYRLSADKRMLFGGLSTYSGRELRDIKKCLLPRMLDIYPQLKGTRIEYEWGGSMGIVIRRIPLIGRIDKNIFYSQGYSGWGVCATHMAGEIMADGVEGNYDRLELFEKMSHIPLPIGRWLGNQMIGLGMMYYKLLDCISNY